MNVPKRKASSRLTSLEGASKTTAKARKAVQPEVIRLRRELAAVKRERDNYLHEIYARMQAETEAMRLDANQLRAMIGQGPTDDQLLAKLAAKKRA